MKMYSVIITVKTYLSTVIVFNNKKSSLKSTWLDFFVTSLVHLWILFVENVICNVANVSPNSRACKTAGSFLACEQELARRLIRSGCHVHLYLHVLRHIGPPRFGRRHQATFLLSQKSVVC